MQKTIVLGVLVVAAGVAVGLQNEHSASPPGVAASAWVAVGENFGFVIRSQVEARDTPDPTNAPPVIHTNDEFGHVNGHFMLRKEGRWYTVSVMQPPHEGPIHIPMKKGGS